MQTSFHYQNSRRIQQSRLARCMPRRLKRRSGKGWASPLYTYIIEAEREWEIDREIVIETEREGGSEKGERE